jgi:hypothetical protein
MILLLTRSFPKHLATKIHCLSSHYYGGDLLDLYLQIIHPPMLFVLFIGLLFSPHYCLSFWFSFSPIVSVNF